MNSTILSLTSASPGWRALCANVTTAEEHPVAAFAVMQHEDGEDVWRTIEAVAVEDVVAGAVVPVAELTGFVALLAPGERAEDCADLVEGWRKRNVTRMPDFKK